MSTRSTPEDGDIVVREEQREAALVYVLHAAPGADQYLLRMRHEAVLQAQTFAQRERVRAWLTTDEGYDFVLLEDFRPTPTGSDNNDERAARVDVLIERAVIERLRAEFLEMPCMRLTAQQVQRLCGIERAVCQSVLDALVDAKFLCRKSDGAYARLAGGEIARRRPAKADVPVDRRSAKAS